ncbi:HNH endonuclease [Ktedonospora formicarum]|uniref:HNH domain-containing protein n=1 Tax=Ktedonospora formicarum TaxID=2778364 RepID=A0A8J3MYG7_9CHLR|nr:HNH endonuclease [Ktedonospora formicarum]GHO49640.1 hypothetical protein KSX_78030 [Ktedonospora formicarum]
MFASDYLTVGNIYTRKELQRQFQIKDATINTGVFRPSGYDSIWLFITELKPKDRPQLHDKLEGETLYWDGQPTGRTDKLIIHHQTQGLELLVFYRHHKDEFPGAGFKYEGRFNYISHEGSEPAHFILKKQSLSLEEIVTKDIEALLIEEDIKTIYQAGKTMPTLVNTYERNPKLRTEAVKLHGTRCQICGFSFAETYGELGKDYIEAHHLQPIASYQNQEEVDPQEEMVVVCANCHRMLHRNPEKPLMPEILQSIVVSRKQKVEEDE